MPSSIDVDVVGLREAKPNLRRTIILAIMRSNADGSWRTPGLRMVFNRALFTDNVLTDANLTGIKLEEIYSFSGNIFQNTIMPDGSIRNDL
jgi:hypothetical protein